LIYNFKGFTLFRYF